MLRLLMLSMLLSCASAHAEPLQFVTEDFPPFSYPSDTFQDESSVTAAGPMADMVNAACAQLNTPCSIELLPWRRALSRAQQGEVQGIFTVIDSEQRRQDFYISRMLIKSAYSLYSHTNSRFIYNKIGDLAGRRVAVYGPSGTSYVLSQALASIPDSKIELLPNNRGLLRMLDSGRFGDEGLIVINQDVAEQLISQEQLTNVRHIGTLAEVAYGIGFSKASVSESRFAEFDNALAALIADGTLSKILQRYQLQSAW